MSLVRPNAVITLDGKAYSAAEAALVGLRASLSVRGSHDRVALRVWPTSKLAKASVGSSLSIALGDAGAETDIWSGEVADVAAAPDAITITGLAATIALSRTRVSQSYVDRSVADIVRDLASGVDVDAVEADVSLPIYAVDDRRPVWGHLLDLAALAGCEVGASAAGALRFVPVRTGSATVSLRHGADILGWSLAAAAQPDAPSVASYGAASEAGSAQWHWILRSPAPQGSGPFTRILPAIRTRDGAEAAAQALSARAARAATRGRLDLVGRAGLRPGDLIEIKDLPAGNPATLRAVAVDHLLDTRAGFRSAVSIGGASP
jgi:hypothetical protein